MSSLAVYGAKVATFSGMGALPASLLFAGVVAGAALMAGSYCARFFVLRMSPTGHARVLDSLLLVSGATLLWAAVR